VKRTFSRDSNSKFLAKTLFHVEREREIEKEGGRERAWKRGGEREIDRDLQNSQQSNVSVMIFPTSHSYFTYRFPHQPPPRVEDNRERGKFQHCPNKRLYYVE